MIYLLRRRKLGRTSCRMISEFSQKGIQTFRNDARLPPADLVFRWGCTSDVPGRNVVNTAAAIHLVSNKKDFRRILDEKELCPKTWFNTRDIVLPCVIRPAFHHQGRNLYVCNTTADVQRAVARHPDFYASALINKVAEYRVFVAQGRAVWVAKKTPGNPDQVAWNVAQGGRFDNVSWDNWPLKAVKYSIQAMELSGLDFGGVDVMVDAANNVFVLEINSAPSQTSEYRQKCTAKAFDYIATHGKTTIPLTPETGGYLKFIHPAICERARMI